MGEDRCLHNFHCPAPDVWRQPMNNTAHRSVEHLDFVRERPALPERTEEVEPELLSPSEALWILERRLAHHGT